MPGALGYAGLKRGYRNIIRYARTPCRARARSPPPLDRPPLFEAGKRTFFNLSIDCPRGTLSCGGAAPGVVSSFPDRPGRMSAQSVLHDTQSRHGQSVLRKRYRYASAVGKLAFVSIGSLCSLFPLPCVQGFLSGVHFGVPQGFRLGSAAIARRPLSLHSLTCPARKGLLHAQVLGGVIGAKSTRVGTSRPAGLLQRHLSMSAGGADAEKLTVAQVEAMTVPQVKKALRVRGLSDRGKAAELRQLLVEACAADASVSQRCWSRSCRGRSRGTSTGSKSSTGARSRRAQVAAPAPDRHGNPSPRRCQSSALQPDLTSRKGKE